MADVTLTSHSMQVTLLVSVCGMYLASGMIFLVAARFMPALDPATLKGSEVGTVAHHAIATLSPLTEIVNHALDCICNNLVGVHAHVRRDGTVS